MPGPQSAPDLPSVGAEADPLLGRVLNDRYRILEVIGHGGMGRVYKALQAPLDRLVALKILGAGHDRDPNFYKRFFLEASVTAKLTHPNTITLYDYGRTEDGVFFIAMEYLNGRTLSQAMQADGPLAQERVIHIAQQICRSLQEAPVPPADARPDLRIAPDLQEVVLRCMAKNREERFQSMDELLAQLKAVRTRLTGAPQASTPEPQAKASSGAMAQTPPTPQPGLRTPSQPMSALRVTPPRGMSRPPPPPPADAFAEQATPIRHRVPLARWPVIAAKIASILRVAVAPALIVLAGIGSAVYVLRAPLHVPVVQVPPPSAQPRPSVAPPAASPVVTIPPAPPAPSVPPVTFVTVTSAPSGAEVRDTNGRLLGKT